MGLGSKRKRRKLYFCNIKAQNEKKQTDPHFLVTFKNAANQKVQQHETEISGKLYSIGHDTYNYEGAVQQTIIVTLVDGEEQFKIEANMETSTTRSIVNSILGREPKGYDDTVFFRLYKTTKDIAGQGSKDFAQLYIGGEAKGSGWDWKWKPEDVKPLQKKFYNPKIKRDDTDNSDLIEMMMGQWKELCDRLNAKLAAKWKTIDEQRGLENAEGDETIQPEATGGSHAGTGGGISTLANDPVKSVNNPEASGSSPIDNSTDDLPF